MCDLLPSERLQMSGPLYEPEVEDEMTEPILFPSAVWKPLVGHSHPGSLAQRDTVVLHITDGATAAGAIAWFGQSSGAAAVSAHFVIDRDGTIFQLLSISETAWHANSANGHTIGIEHAAIAGKLLCTEEQYAASALLVKWLCGQMKVPCDRTHVRSHFEVDQAHLHVQCCAGGLDPDRVVSIAAALNDPIGPNDSIPT